MNMEGPPNHTPEGGGENSAEKKDETPIEDAGMEGSALDDAFAALSEAPLETTPEESGVESTEQPKETVEQVEAQEHQGEESGASIDDLRKKAEEHAENESNEQKEEGDEERQPEEKKKIVHGQKRRSSKKKRSVKQIQAGMDKTLRESAEQEDGENITETEAPVETEQAEVSENTPASDANPEALERYQEARKLYRDEVDKIQTAKQTYYAAVEKYEESHKFGAFLSKTFGINSSDDELVAAEQEYNELLDKLPALRDERLKAFKALRLKEGDTEAGTHTERSTGMNMEVAAWYEAMLEARADAHVHEMEELRSPRYEKERIRGRIWKSLQARAQWWGSLSLTQRAKWSAGLGAGAVLTATGFGAAFFGASIAAGVGTAAAVGARRAIGTVAGGLAAQKFGKALGKKARERLEGRAERLHGEEQEELKEDLKKSVRSSLQSRMEATGTPASQDAVSSETVSADTEGEEVSQVEEHVPPELEQSENIEESTEAQVEEIRPSQVFERRRSIEKRKKRRKFMAKSAEVGTVGAVGFAAGAGSNVALGSIYDGYAGSDNAAETVVEGDVEVQDAAPETPVEESVPEVQGQAEVAVETAQQVQEQAETAQQVQEQADTAQETVPQDPFKPVESEKPPFYLHDPTVEQMKMEEMMFPERESLVLEPGEGAVVPEDEGLHPDMFNELMEGGPANESGAPEAVPDELAEEAPDVNVAVGEPTPTIEEIMHVAQGGARDLPDLPPDMPEHFELSEAEKKLYTRMGQPIPTEDEMRAQYIEAWRNSVPQEDGTLVGESKRSFQRSSTYESAPHDGTMTVESDAGSTGLMPDVHEVLRVGGVTGEAPEMSPPPPGLYRPAGVEGVEASTEMVVEIKMGDNLWDTIADKLEEQELILSKDEIQTLKAQGGDWEAALFHRNHFIDELKNHFKVLEKQGKLGELGFRQDVHGTYSIDHVYPGDRIDLTPVLSDRDTLIEALNNANEHLVAGDHGAPEASVETVVSEPVESSYEPDAVPEQVNEPAIDEEGNMSEPYVEGDSLWNNLLDKLKGGKEVELEEDVSTPEAAVESGNEVSAEEISSAESVTRNLEQVRSQLPDYRGTKTLGFFKTVWGELAEQGLLKPHILGRYHSLQSSWGPLSHVNVRDLYDSTDGVVWNIDGTELKLNPETEMELKKIVDATKDLPGGEELYENAKEKGSSVALYFAQLAEALDKEEGASSAAAAASAENASSAIFHNPLTDVVETEDVGTATPPSAPHGNGGHQPQHHAGGHGHEASHHTPHGPGEVPKIREWENRRFSFEGTIGTAGETPIPDGSVESGVGMRVGYGGVRVHNYQLPNMPENARLLGMSERYIRNEFLKVHPEWETHEITAAELYYNDPAYHAAVDKKIMQVELGLMRQGYHTGHDRLNVVLSDADDRLAPHELLLKLEKHKNSLQHFGTPDGRPRGGSQTLFGKKWTWRK